MKIRNGFVSNSSSSSFICMFGKVTDKAKVNEILNFKHAPDFEILTGEELSQFKRCYYAKDSIEIKSVDYANVNINYPIADIDVNAEYIILTSGDDIDESDGDPDYDVSYNDFSDHRIIDKLLKTCVREIDTQYGAGRNG